MLGYLILAILAGFIAVAAIRTIRSRPKLRPKVAKEKPLKCCKPKPAIPAPEETLKCDKPAPAIPAPEETLKCDKPAPAIPTPEETLKCDKPAPAIPTPEETPKETSNYSKEEREACLRRLNETSRIENYLKDDKLGSYMDNKLGSYMIDSGRNQYLIRYMSDTAMQHPPVVLHRPFSTSESIRLLDELCSCSKWQQFGIKPKYIGTLKDFLQSDNKICYYTALEYIYYHLLLETNPDANVNLEKLKLLDDAELYRIFKDSIPRNIDYLRMVSYGVAETYDCTLYEIVQKIDKMFCSTLEQRKLPVPE